MLSLRIKFSSTGQFDLDFRILIHFVVNKKHRTQPFVRVKRSPIYHKLSCQVTIIMQYYSLNAGQYDTFIILSTVKSNILQLPIIMMWFSCRHCSYRS